MTNCAFCELLDAGCLAEVTRGVGVYVLEPLNPVTPGHLLFLPREHIASPDEQPAIAGLVMTQAAKYARRVQAATSYNYIVNAGAPASQTVMHLHLHLVPRRPNDGLVLPWTNQKKGT